MRFPAGARELRRANDGLRHSQRMGTCVCQSEALA
jgi:hypothetical protein